MFTIKDMKILAFLILWSILLGPCYASQYNYVNYKVSSNNSVVTLNVPLTFDNNNARHWRSIGYFLTSSTYKTYVLNWQGYGGSVSDAKQFIKSIQAAEAQGKSIIIKLTGGSYSMHALVPCYATKVLHNNIFFFMYHADSYGKYRLTRGYSTITQQLNQCIQTEFLTNYEVNKMWDGYEVYTKTTKTWYKRDPRPLG